MTSQRTQISRDDDGVWVHVPVSERGEAVGVLELLLAETPGAHTLDYLSSAGHALAYVVIADRRFSDLYELGQRSTVVSLEAEIQRRLLPSSYACEGPQFALAGWLVPADDAGGDTFDYMVDRDTLHLSITDAMGHGVPAAQLATLGVGGLRNSRRRGLGLTEQAQQASTHIAAHAAPDQFVTALLGRLDLPTGALELVNAGHMNPLLVRDGQVTEIPLDAGLVLGVAPDEAYDVQRFQLLPGDRLSFVTDGISERDASEAEIEKLLGTLGHLHPCETVQVLTGAVLHVHRWGSARRRHRAHRGLVRQLPRPVRATSSGERSTDEHRAGPAAGELSWRPLPKCPSGLAPEQDGTRLKADNCGRRPLLSGHSRRSGWERRAGRRHLATRFRRPPGRLRGGGKTRPAAVSRQGAGAGAPHWLAAVSSDAANPAASVSMTPQHSNERDAP